MRLKSMNGTGAAQKFGSEYGVFALMSAHIYENHSRF
jgi:hypothetical protein